MKVACDSSPLIYMAALSDFKLLRMLFGELIIPRAIFREVVENGSQYPAAAAVQSALGSWIFLVPIQTRPADSQFLGYDLHDGEKEAITLATEAGAAAILIDDREAVRYVRERGMIAIPTPAIYVRAKRQGLIRSISEKLDALRTEGFWLADRDYQSILRSVQES